MNRYGTLTLKEIHKLTKLVMCSRNVPKLGMCGVTSVDVDVDVLFVVISKE